MKIESITPASIRKVDNRELYSLRLRFLQIWDKHYGGEIKKLNIPEREVILKKYHILNEEMGTRKLSHDTKEIDKVIFRKSLYGVDVPCMKEEVLIEDVIYVSGDYIKSPKSTKTLSLAIKKGEDITERIVKFIGEEMRKQVGKTVNTEIVTDNVDSDYIPLYDMVIRPKKITKRVMVSKPETTEKYHRIPVTTCKITATIDISEKKGIKALYCGGAGDKKIATYLFDVKKWTMERAKAWVKEQKVKKVELFECECIECGYKVKSEKHCKDIKCPKCGGTMRRAERPGPGEPTIKKEEDKLDKNIPIFKIDEEKRIVGGVVYAPDEIDSQGDTANSEEIEKAAHKFNVEVRKFKVNHKGKNRNIDLLESYIMPADVSINNQIIKKGSWFIVCKVNDDDIWEAVKEGELTGFSMMGWATPSYA